MRFFCVYLPRNLRELSMWKCLWMARYGQIVERSSTTGSAVLAVSAKMVNRRNVLLVLSALLEASTTRFAALGLFNRPLELLCVIPVPSEGCVLTLECAMRAICARLATSVTAARRLWPPSPAFQVTFAVLGRKLQTRRRSTRSTGLGRALRASIAARACRQ